ncbi:MAG: PKD domain-containing protein [Flavobacteriales bacterium]|nr:PKD domain-containing protein [Flavobacteriales bacterium]
MNGMDAFERSVRKSLEDFEVPYNSSDWARMEQALDGGGRGASPFTTSTLWLLLAGATALAGGTYVLLNQPEKTKLVLEGYSDQASEVTSQLVENAIDASAKVVVTNPADTDMTSPVTGKAPEASAKNISDAGVQASNKPVKEQASTGTAGGGSSVIPIPADTKPKTGFSTSISEGCEGASVEFKVEGMQETGIYLWNFGDGNFSNKPNPTHTFTKPGKFMVTLSMSAPGMGTIENKPFADMVVINEAPQAGFNPLKQEYSGHVPFVHFENRSIGANHYSWDFGDGTTSQVAHPDHVYRKKGEYRVQLLVMNEAGCTDFLERVVRIDSDYNLLAPAVFSPNGDGQADTFMPEALKDLNVRFKLSIYEPATGRLVYETIDASKPWTGRLLNRADLCTTGEYVWMAEIHEGLHLGGVNFEGKVSLVR